MLKGQTALEFLLIVSMVITMAMLTTNIYNIESRTTLADAAVRAEADTILAKASLIAPNCSTARLENITIVDGRRAQDFLISTTMADCDETIFTNTTLARIVDKIHRSERCIASLGDACEQIVYNVCAGDNCAW